MNRARLHSIASLGAAITVSLSLVGCDFSVTNPGPIDDSRLQGDNLKDPLTRRSMTAGMRRALADAIDVILYWGAAITFEINPAGSTGSFGIPTQVQNGVLRPEENNWSDAQVARWVAEEGIRRFKAANVPEDSFFAVAYLWAGYANRLLGENFCDAVFDGGPKEPFTRFFQRADSQFTEALRIASGLTSPTVRTALTSAAYAGRASVRAFLATYNNNNAALWAQAAADARQVASTYRWQMPYSDQDQTQYNYLYWAQANSPYRAHTVWATYYENYYRTTRDPRVRWDSTGLRGDAAVDKFRTYPNVVNSRVPFWPQAKYTSRSSPINLSSGWEMRLIEAEEALVRGDTTAALALINARRSALSPAQPPANAGGTIAGAWTQLKRERMLELWLEARRLGDLRRWKAANTPGVTFDGVWVTGEATPRETMDTPVQRALCFPIGKAEIETNPNLR